MNVYIVTHACTSGRLIIQNTLMGMQKTYTCRATPPRENWDHVLPDSIYHCKNSAHFNPYRVTSAAALAPENAQLHVVQIYYELNWRNMCVKKPFLLAVM